MQRAITLTELGPIPFNSNTNVHLVDINVFAKLDEIPSLPVQVILETSSPKGNDRSPESNVPSQSAPKPYAAFLPP